MKKVGILGTGFMGKTHAKAWMHTDAQLAGCVSKNKDEIKAFSNQFGVKMFDDLESMLPEVDIVDICVPTFLHHEMVVKAAAAGKDIVCEKPLSLTLDEGIDMLRKCETAGVKLLVAHVVRFFPEYAAAHEQILAGEVGNVAVIRLERQGFQPYNEFDNWYIDQMKSGGMIHDLMIHDIDFARWIAGDVEKVYAKNILLSTKFKSTADHAMAILTHANGVITHITNSWAMPKPTFRTSIEIGGSEGLLRYDSGSATPIHISLHRSMKDDQSVRLPGIPMIENPYTTQIKEFYNNITHGTPARIKAEDGLAAVQISRAIIESAKSGKAIHIPSLREVIS